MPSGCGVPPGWEGIAQRVREKTGRALVLEPVPEGFSNGPQHVAVLLDGELLGDFEFAWPDRQPPEQTLADLREQLAWFLDELFSDGWW